MVKMIIIGVSGLVVALGLTVGALLFLGKKEAAVTADKTTATADSTKATREHQPSQTTPATGHAEPSHDAVNTQTPHDTAMDTALTAQGLSETDLHAIDNIVANLQSIDVPLETPITDTTKKATTSPTSTSNASTTTSTSTDTSALASKEASLAKREKALEELQKSLEKREQEIARKMLVIDQAQSNRVATLAKLYDSMDPSQAAAVMQGIDDETIVMILPRMKTQNAAGVLSQLPPQRASLLSKKMISIADEGL